MGIKNGLVYIEPGVLDDDTKAGSAAAEKKSSSSSSSYLRLNNNSALYAEARDLNISALGPLLQGQSSQVNVFISFVMVVYDCCTLLSVPVLN